MKIALTFLLVFTTTGLFSQWVKCGSQDFIYVMKSYIEKVQKPPQPGKYNSYSFETRSYEGYEDSIANTKLNGVICVNSEGAYTIWQNKGLIICYDSVQLTIDSTNNTIYLSRYTGTMFSAVPEADSSFLRADFYSKKSKNTTEYSLLTTENSLIKSIEYVFTRGLLSRVSFFSSINETKNYWDPTLVEDKLGKIEMSFSNYLFDSIAPIRFFTSEQIRLNLERLMIEGEYFTEFDIVDLR